VIASLSIAGCTSSTNSSQTPSATTSAATKHDAFLETYLAAYRNTTYASNSTHITAWELDWINGTIARQHTVLNKSTNLTRAYDETVMVFPTSQDATNDETVMVFPTSQDATNYVNAMNLTAYSLASTEYSSGGAYQNVTGHAPQIYKEYHYNEGNSLDISAYRLHDISQLDNLVSITTGKVLS
jgi:hypothetical protein